MLNGCATIRAAVVLGVASFPANASTQAQVRHFGASAIILLTDLLTVSLSACSLSFALKVTRTDNVSFNINLAGLPQLPAGTYTETVTIEALAG